MRRSWKALAACVLSALSAAAAAQGELGPEKAATLPLADVHFHAMPFMAAPDLVA